MEASFPSSSLTPRVFTKIGSNPPPFCHPTALDVAVVVFVTFAVGFIWWIFELPLIFQHSFAEFLRQAAWQTTRVSSPTYVAQTALMRSHNPKDWPHLYYFGIASNTGAENSIDRLTPWLYVKIAMYEIPTVVAAILCAYRWSIMDPAPEFRPMTGEWIAGCLPTVPIAITILLASRFSPKHLCRRSFVYVAGSVALIGVGAAYGLGLYFGPPRPSENATKPTDMIRYACYYAVVMLPWPLIPWKQVPFLEKREYFLKLVSVLPALLVRVFGYALTIGDLRDLSDYDCSTGFIKLQGAYFAFSTVGFLFVFIGLACCEGMRETEQVNSGHDRIPLEPQNTDQEQPKDTTADTECPPPYSSRAPTQNMDTEALLPSTSAAPKK